MSNNETEQESIESLKYQVRQWRTLVTKYLPETNCDRDDVAAIGGVIESLKAKLKIAEEITKKTRVLWDEYKQISESNSEENKRLVDSLEYRITSGNNIEVERIIIYRDEVLQIIDAFSNKEENFNESNNDNTNK